MELENELRDGQKNFFIHDAVLALDGYDYYAYLSITGNSYIMRRNTAGTETLYANGGFDLASWSGKVALPYDSIRKLAL
ncbi:hypothetical protein LCGC14_0306320 [marine sediment metagenome]|uniref:Uncharacterized protein n=1 Tax=marine sediment metagenome TaxID=412755 RepID=A0A0F9WV77_9ZZZZ